jgi:hypothetical protein
VYCYHAGMADKLPVCAAIAILSEGVHGHFDEETG